MIDLGEQFKRMSQEFDIEDKVVLKSVRTMLREAWGSSIFKQEFIKKEPDKKRMLDALVCLGSIANNLIRLNQDKGWVR